MQYRREIEVACDPADAFSYVADFANAAEWDPGVVESRRLTEAPTAVGSRFELIGLFRGRRHRFESVVTDYEEGRRIVLRVQGDKAHSVDVVTLSGGNGRTRLEYLSDIALTGPYRLAEPFLRRTFTRMGDAALDGLSETLARRFGRGSAGN